jgi:hypothetical protein
MKKIILIFSLSLALFSCKKEIDHPPITVLADNQIITLDTLLAMYQGEDILFDKDVSIYATVTMDEVDGNVYKNLFIQDGNSAINMRLESSGDLFVGDYIRVNLNGTLLSKFSGVMQLDQVDFDKNIAIQKSNVPLAAKITTIEELNASFITTLATEPNDPTYKWEYASKLVKLENVQFSAGSINSTYADGPAQQSKDITVEDCFGNQLIVRSSGYANFANDTLASGNGDMVVIVSRYNDALQLTIRSINEVNFAAQRCAGELFKKDFEDEDAFSGGWNIAQITGSDTWEVGYFGTYALKISNYTTTNNACESWYYSSPIDLTNSTSSSMSFMNDTRYNGPQLQLLISTDYDGIGNPSQTGTWTDITTSVSWDPNTGDWGLVPTGNIDLSQFVGNNIVIAFKYTGSDSDGATWELDDIKVIG